MKSIVSKELSKFIPLSKEEIESILEVPPSQVLGDFSFPCFTLSKSLKKNPVAISQELSSKISSKIFEKVESKGPYVNIFINSSYLAELILSAILKEKKQYGSSNIGKGKKMIVEMSSPNIAKPFGIGHLRSTIIGNSIANISSFVGFKTTKLNYLGDWGTPFGKILLGYKKFGSEKKLKENPIQHLYELYVKINSLPELEQESRDWFRKLENKDAEAVKLWKEFRKYSIENFDKIYSLLGIKFDVISGESMYENKLDSVVSELKKKNLLKESEGALVVDLEKYNLGVCLIQKNDGTTLYATRDIAAAIDRQKKYGFHKMLYEVGGEQKLHLSQVFKVLELLGHTWAKDCIHVAHGLYLDSDGKKFSTRKGKSIFMQDIYDETKTLAIKELEKREKLSRKELEERGDKIALASIFYGDLKHYREQNIVFDIEKFVQFEGNTGPYLLYSYARARSILRKSNSSKKVKVNISELSKEEKALILELSRFPQVVLESNNSLAPNLIANYSFELSKKFNEYYHSNKIIGSESESLGISIVNSFSIVLENSLSLLGINVVEKM